METTGGRFLFQKRNAVIDWRKLASVDVDRVAREVDVDAIQDNILNVTYCNIEHELGAHSLEQNFIKLFRLAQLMIEYLLHCQDYLQQCLVERDGKLASADKKLQDAVDEQNDIKANLAKRNEAYRSLKKELIKCRKLIGDYQLMIRAGASGAHKCPYCQKSFVSEFYVRSHIERRHVEHAGKSMLGYATQATTQQSSDGAIYSDLQNELNQIKTRLKVTEDELQQERKQHTRLKEAEEEHYGKMVAELKIEHHKWKVEEQERMKNEMSKFKDMMIGELRQIQNEKQILQQNLEELQLRTSKPKSNLGDLEDDDEKSQKLHDIYAKLSELEEANLESLRRMEENSKRREKNMKLQYDKKLSDAYQKIEETEERNARAQKKISDLVEELHTHSMEASKKSVAETQKALQRAQPPPPPPRTPEGLDAGHDAGEAVDPDTACHWVSSSSNLNYRVLRSASTAKGEWKDLFTFFALTRPVGVFNKPVYVYSSGGSPFWRQYVSSSATPPRPNYKLDFVFYVSVTSLLGTFKLHVLDSGSGAVVKSVISKSEVLDGWKEKALWFYVLKASSLNALNRSGTDVADVTGSDDEVSVSSLTGTDDAKKNLAEALKRSREELNERPRDSAADDAKIRQNSTIDVGNPVPDGDKHLLSRKEDILAASSSTSVWDSLRLERGEFYPYPDNPLAVARYKHDREMVDDQRKEIIEIFEENIEKRGVDPDELRMTSRAYEAKMKPRDNEMKGYARQFPDFTTIRKRLASDLDAFVSEKFKKKTKDGERGKAKLRSAASAVKSAARLFAPSKESASAEAVANQTVDSVGSSVGSTLVSTGRASSGTITSVFDETSVRGNEYAVDVHARTPAATAAGAREPKPAPRQISARVPDVSLEADEENDDDAFDVSDSSGWESDPDAVEGHNDSRNTENADALAAQEPYQPKLRAPRGEKVKELTASLEASLTKSRNAGPTKRLAGMVDLSKSLEDQDKDALPPRRQVTFQDDPQDRDENDSGSDFSVTSVEGTGTVSAEKRTPTGRPVVADDDDDEDIDKILASYQPSALRDRSRITSSTPKSAASQSTAVTAFKLEDDDDFSSGDSSELELKHLQ